MNRRKLHYHLVDVFTDCVFGGNQLAVFTNGRGLSATTMQAIANELNLPETTFVLPPLDPSHDFRVRIFTPIAELPMGGHPTIGTAFVLAGDYMIDRSETDVQIQLEEEVGVIPVSIQFKKGQPSLIRMTQQLPTFGPEYPDVPTIAEILAIEPDAITDTNLPVQVVSCGVPFLFVPVRDLATIHRVRLHRGAWEQALRDFEAPHLFVFTREVERDDSTVHSRAFVPAFGVEEDPATGGASGPLGCYLVHHRVVSVDRTTVIISEQGFEMGRPSIVRTEIDTEDDEIIGVRVGGTCCPVGEGVLEVM